MPEISRFFGIVVAIYYNDHDPPHFHAKYGDRTGVLSIESLKVRAVYPAERCCWCLSGLSNIGTS